MVIGYNLALDLGRFALYFWFEQSILAILGIFLFRLGINLLILQNKFGRLGNYL